jgi:holliday junction DNA helicase RuvA
MIAHLRGAVADKSAGEVVIDAGGVGYRVFMSLLSSSRVPSLGEPCSLRIRTVVREDALDLYGFLTRAEEELFLLLHSVTGVGPKLALAVLSGMEAEQLLETLRKGDVARLTKIHGVGKKTAERLVLELRDKAKKLFPDTADTQTRAPGTSGAFQDLVSALLNLGYKEPQAEKAAEVAMATSGEGSPFETLFREAMKAVRSTS